MPRDIKEVAKMTYNLRVGMLSGIQVKVCLELANNLYVASVKFYAGSICARQVHWSKANVIKSWERVNEVKI
ncbi:hypothetical protein L1987_07011 [Smallanthus sonchifolius]|uniref:Uncharacterized protein n=1 Tax=Smallanthus sonchifolius TaxID=185202 RepID=A0ACB9JZW0_9ASTR|nr:hypothetical protein L1987_07011 [Smallanthus sonchifolius]